MGLGWGTWGHGAGINGIWGGVHWGWGLGPCLCVLCLLCCLLLPVLFALTPSALANGCIKSGQLDVTGG